MSKICPVIHFHDDRHALQEAAKIAAAGCYGTFLISHANQDIKLLKAAVKVKRAHPKLKVGVNLLSVPENIAYVQMLSHELDMLWFDQQLSSAGPTAEQQELANSREYFGGFVFAATAFKYQAPESDPEKAAENAVKLGFIPTTSGPGTGKPPTFEKIARMSSAAGGRLAVASGMTAENVGTFKPLLEFILVASSLYQRPDVIEESLLQAFVQAAT